MTGGWFQPWRLQFNDTIAYRCAGVAPHNQNPTPAQPASEGSYSGKVVDFTDDGMVGVRADGWWGTQRSWALLESDKSSNGG
jgi:hypothetical protein